MAPICLPMNAFLRGERPLCFNVSPWTETGGGRRRVLCVILLFFNLSNSLRRFFFYLPSLKPNNNKNDFFHTITYYYFQTKQFIKKNLSRKEISRNVIWLPENFIWYLMDAVPRGGSVGENQKNISLHMVFCATETHPPHIQPHTLLHYWSITIQGCPCWVKTIHLQ